MVFFESIRQMVIYIVIVYTILLLLISFIVFKFTGNFQSQIFKTHCYFILAIIGAYLMGITFGEIITK